VGEVIDLPGRALAPTSAAVPARTPSQQWMTAAEIAAARLPGLPTSERRIRERAIREEWRAQPRFGREGGGGQEFLVADLPERARDALRRRLERERLHAITVDPSPLRREADLAGWQLEIQTARIAVIREIEQRARRMSLTKAIDSLAADSIAGRMSEYLTSKAPRANARSRRDGAATFSARTLFRWWSQWQTGGFVALAPLESTVEAGPPPWANAFLTLWRFPTKRSIHAVMDDLPERLPAGVAMPSYDQVRRFLKSLPVVERERGRRGAQDLKALKGHVRRTTDHMLPLDVIISDGHCFDADDVAHPIHGRPFRPELSAVLDVATRRAIGWSAAVAESTWATVGALKMALKAGLPAMFYTDRGSGYCNQIVTDMLQRMGCTHTTALPYNSQARGMIERAHQSIWIRAAKSRAGYLGRDMDKTARRKFLRVVKSDLKETDSSPLLTPWPDFMSWCQGVIDAYNDRPHRGLPKIQDPETGKMRHQSPNEAWEAHQLAGWEPMLVNAAELTDLVRPYEVRVTARGSVSLIGNSYYLKALEDHHGRSVKVGYDLHDATHVWVRDMADNLIGRAALDGMARPYMPVTAVEKAREERGKRRLKTIRNNEAEVLAEMGAGLLEGGVIDLAARRAAQTALIELTPEQEELADAALARFDAEETPIPGQVETESGRPIFNDDFSWAQWVLENPTLAEAQDHELLRQRMRSMSFRMALGITDEDESEAVPGA
jgi:putative transposase